MGLTHQSPSELVAFFTHALASFQSSPDLFRILLTLPPLHPSQSHPHPHPHSHSHHAHPKGQRARSSGRLLVLDSSFNPPTTAHARMALSALRAEQQDSDSRPESHHPGSLPDPHTRLVLLLAVQNADKAPDKPAALAQRLCMMDIFARGLQREGAGDSAHGLGVPIDVAVTKTPFFCDKARALAACEAYTSSASGTGSGFENSSSSPSPHPPTTPRSTPIPSLRQPTGGGSGGSIGGGNAAIVPEQQPQMVFLVGFDTVIRILDPKYYPGGMGPALAPLFARARLRVTGRPGGGWGGPAEQERWVADLAGELAARGGDAAWAGRIELVGEGEGEIPEEGVSSSRAREVVGRGELEKLGGLVDEGVRGWIVKGGLYT